MDIVDRAKLTILASKNLRATDPTLSAADKQMLQNQEVIMRMVAEMMNFWSRPQIEE
jgi:hypothetical protein